MYKCTRPDWSTYENDECICDRDDEYINMMNADLNPCETCIWYKDMEEWQ